MKNGDMVHYRATKLTERMYPALVLKTYSAFERAPEENADTDWAKRAFSGVVDLLVFTANGTTYVSEVEEDTEPVPAKNQVPGASLNVISRPGTFTRIQPVDLI